jgi:hypothetical protein
MARVFSALNLIAQSQWQDFAKLLVDYWRLGDIF